MAKKKQEGESIAETAKTIVYALLIAGVVRTLFFQPFWIPTSSMKPTLLIGDYLVINKMAYGYSRHSCPWSLCPITGRILGGDPEAGDVVVFKHPTSGVDFIKRLIGTPGDKVQLKGGKLFINGVELAQEDQGLFVEEKALQGPMKTQPRCKNEPVGLGADCEKDLAIETMSEDIQYSVLNIGTGGADDTPVFTVPADHYFYLGDNRDNSGDSRFAANGGGVGFVHEDLIVGRADRILFSSAGRRILFFWTWRKDRFFKAVN